MNSGEDILRRFRNREPIDHVSKDHEHQLSVVKELCKEVASLPFQLAYRTLFAAARNDSQEYVRGVAVHGGGCADKALLIAALSRAMGLQPEFVLGGFGANEPLTEDQLANAFEKNPHNEPLPHMYHTAVLVTVGMRRCLLEASGGRVGCFVFDEQRTNSLLSQLCWLICPNISVPLYYHRFSQSLSEAIIYNKVYNRQLLWPMIQRVGLAVAGRWTLRLVNRESNVETNPVFSSPETVFGNLSEIYAHPFLSGLRPETIALLQEAQVAFKRMNAGLPGSIVMYVAEAESDWGINSFLADDEGPTIRS